MILFTKIMDRASGKNVQFVIDGITIFKDVDSCFLPQKNSLLSQNIIFRNQIHVNFCHEKLDHFNQNLIRRNYILTEKKSWIIINY